MHLYAFTRGQKDKVDKYISDLQAQWLMYKTNPHMPEQPIQFGVRPIQLWEFAFPAPEYDMVMRMLHPAMMSNFSTANGIMRKFLALACKLKKLMGLEDCPEYKKLDKEGKAIPTPLVLNTCVDIKAIGIKKDEYQPIELI